MWTPEGKLPIVITTGSHKKTCVFGTITFDGRQLFRQYDTFDQYSFISYLRDSELLSDVIYVKLTHPNYNR
jgi:hypothetical protein